MQNDMHETGKKLFNLMFRPEETICISDSKYGYHSIPLKNAINGPVILVPKEETARKMGMSSEEATHIITTDNILLCALNPIKGFREDINCTSFRNFLVEIDYGPLPQQLEYIKKLKMPYSAVIFSGNKSLHFLISTEIDLPSEKIYRLFSEWILNIVTLADQNTKNPSRSIRVPGAYREPGKKQIMVEYHGPIKIHDLISWLNNYPDARPKEKQQHAVSEKQDFDKIKPWICKKIYDGIRPPERNRQWFAIGVEFALSGYGEEYTIGVLKTYFIPDNDFKEREWETTIRSAFKFAYKKEAQ